MTPDTFDPRACCDLIGEILFELQGGSHNGAEVGGAPLDVLADLATLIEAMTEERGASFDHPGMAALLSRLSHRAALSAETMRAAMERCRVLARAGAGHRLHKGDATEAARLLSEAAE